MLYLGSGAEGWLEGHSDILKTLDYVYCKLALDKSLIASLLLDLLILPNPNNFVMKIYNRFRQMNKSEAYKMVKGSFI